MKHKLAELLKSITPPVVFDLLRHSRKPIFQGNYGTWDEARMASGGYDSAVVLDKVKNALLSVKKGEAAYERDSVLFEQVHYSWPLLAALLWIATKSRNRLDIVDFGGSLGSTYFQNRVFLSHLSEVHWNIVEQPTFVQCGRDHFQDASLRFYHTINDCLKENRPSAFILSSVLPYLENPHDVLDEIVRYRVNYVILDRTPILNRGDDRLTVQTVPPEIYGASYPAWFFNRDRLLAHFKNDYELIAEFDALSGKFDLSNAFAMDKGFLFALKLRE